MNIVMFMDAFRGVPVFLLLTLYISRAFLHRIFPNLLDLKGEFAEIDLLSLLK